MAPVSPLFPVTPRIGFRSPRQVVFSSVSLQSDLYFHEDGPYLAPMTNFWFSATYYVFLGYNRRRLQSRVQ
jgi:hypothetical protein